MNKTNLKQGTLKWEKARATRIGSSEIFDIVRYYATSKELQNCGINAEQLRAEKPYTTAWALYHKMLADGIYQKQELAPELAEYGHAVEPYGVDVLQRGRRLKLKPTDVYVSDRLIASLDVSGISEEIDEKPFDYGNGYVRSGKVFVCEQKTMMPSVIKNGLPLKYIIQAQYQVAMTGADFYILQLMVLNNDTVFERGKIVQMSNKKRAEYLQDKMKVTHLYFQNNEHLAMLIKACIKRFFDDVDSHKEPKAFVGYDSARNIIDSIRINTFYNRDLELEFDLTEYIEAKKAVEEAEIVQQASLQEIVEAAKKFNVSRFVSPDGTTASFSANGAFRIKAPKG